MPVAVIISKADLFKPEIGYPRIQAAYNKPLRALLIKNGKNSSYEAYNAFCYKFLLEHRFGNCCNLIASSFNHVRMFPVSVMDSDPSPGKAYETRGILEPMAK